MSKLKSRTRLSIERKRKGGSWQQTWHLVVQKTQITECGGAENLDFPHLLFFVGVALIRLQHVSFEKREMKALFKRISGASNPFSGSSGIRRCELDLGTMYPKQRDLYKKRSNATHIIKKEDSH